MTVKNHPVSNLLIFTEIYFLQRRTTSSLISQVDFLLTNFGVAELLHTKQSWEAMGISRSQLTSTMIIDQHGNEQHPFMKMNGIIIDEHSPEVISRMRFMRRSSSFFFHYASGTYGNREGMQWSLRRRCSSISPKRSVPYFGQDPATTYLFAD